MKQRETRLTYYTLTCSICGNKWTKTVSSYQDLFDYMFHTDTCPVGCHLFDLNMLGKVDFVPMRVVYGHSDDNLIDVTPDMGYNESVLNQKTTPKKQELVAVAGSKIKDANQVLRYAWLGFEHDPVNDIWYVPEQEAQHDEHI